MAGGLGVRLQEGTVQARVPPGIQERGVSLDDGAAHVEHPAPGRRTEDVQGATGRSQDSAITSSVRRRRQE